MLIKLRHNVLQVRGEVSATIDNNLEEYGLARKYLPSYLTATTDEESVQIGVDMEC